MHQLEPISPRFIGDPRLESLLSACGHDVALAHRLFVWNLHASGAAMEAIHVFELLLRNAMDRELRLWNLEATGTAEWLLNPDPLIAKVMHPVDLDRTRQRATQVASDQRRELRHDDVLAQLSLGNWRFLLPSKATKAKQRLWEGALRHAFPVWPGRWGPESIVSRVANAHALRNRVAHLEPLHRFDLRRARRDMRSVCHAIGPDAARFFVQNERMLAVIEANPLASSAGESTPAGATPTRWSPAAST